MPVNALSSGYTEAYPDWQQLRDTMAGEKAVKAQKTKYLPKLESQTEAEYAAYLDRALYFNATRRTRDGLLGMVFRRAPVLALGAGTEKLTPGLSTITRDGQSFQVFARGVLAEMIGMGRYGALVDMPAPGEIGGNSRVQPYLTSYKAEDIISWRQKLIRGRMVVDQIVVREAVEKDAEDGFGTIVSVQWRELFLDWKDGGVYKQRVWHEVEVPGKRRSDKPTIEMRVLAEITPTRRGNPFDFIPFVFFGASSLRPDVERSPLQDISDLNIHHFKAAADLCHGRHYTAIPVYTATGVAEGSTFVAAPNRVWVSTDPETKYGLLEYSGQGLKFAENATQDIERQMAILGARLIVSPLDRGSENPEVVKLRERGEASLLLSLVETAEEGLSLLLRYWAAWQDVEKTDDIKVQLNRDFSDTPLEYRDALMLIRFFQAGVLPLDAILEMLLEGEALPARMTLEKLKELLKDEAQRGVPKPGAVKDGDIVAAPPT